ncbi:MAG: hypothetical protein KMY55_14710 [Dethiosulfatibacter sp.]|nr:hypothetical protein [Dethiosulfatibacter sp.]
MEFRIIREEQSVELLLDVFESSNSNTEGINLRFLSMFQSLRQRMKEAWGSYCSVQVLSGSTISVKAAYGDLLSEFVEVDCGQSIARIEDFLESKIPLSEKEFVDSINKLNTAIEMFLLTHPFSLLSYVDFKDTINNYWVYCDCYVKCDVLKKHTFKWLDKPEIIIFPKISYLRAESGKLVDDLTKYQMDINSNKQDEATMNDEKYDLISRIQKYSTDLRTYADNKIRSIKDSLNDLIYNYSSTRKEYYSILYRCYNLKQKPNLDHLRVAQRFESWADKNDRSFLTKKIQYVHKIRMDDLGNVVLSEEYDVDLSDACFLVLKELILSDTVIKRCEHCKKSFRPKKRTDEKYCRRQVGETSNTCHTIGPLRRGMIKENLNQYQRLYVVYRERYRSRVNRNTMNKEVYEEWKKNATKKRDQAKSKEITYSEFESWVLTKDKNLTKKRIEEKLSK